IMMNGNNKDNPSSIPQFLNELEQGLDYVQGSRFISGGHQENTPLIRHFAIRMIHAPLFSLAAHRWMTDTTNGYRAFSRSFLQDARVHLFQEAFQAYEIEQYMAWKALRLGFECKEISVSRCYPPRNQQKSTASFSKIKPGSGYFLMIKPLLCLNLGLYK
ncbi:MAG: glycosyltransferase family 2 protein, partial [Verrucomicrobiota bacterium]